MQQFISFDLSSPCSALHSTSPCHPLPPVGRCPGCPGYEHDPTPLLHVLQFLSLLAASYDFLPLPAFDDDDADEEGAVDSLDEAADEALLRFPDRPPSSPPPTSPRTSMAASAAALFLASSWASILLTTSALATRSSSFCATSRGSSGNATLVASLRPHASHRSYWSTLCHTTVSGVLMYVAIIGEVLTAWASTAGVVTSVHVRVDRRRSPAALSSSSSSSSALSATSTIPPPLSVLLFRLPFLPSLSTAFSKVVPLTPLTVLAAAGFGLPVSLRSSSALSPLRLAVLLSLSSLSSLSSVDPVVAAAACSFLEADAVVTSGGKNDG